MEEEYVLLCIIKRERCFSSITHKKREIIDIYFKLFVEFIPWQIFLNLRNSTEFLQS